MGFDRAHPWFFPTVWFLEGAMRSSSICCHHETGFHGEEAENVMEAETSELAMVV
jgi:hypothetical protein